MALGIIGVAVMSGAAMSRLDPSKANALSLASAVAIAAEVVLLGRFVARADPMRIAMVTVAVTAVLAAGLGLATGEADPRATASLAWIIVGFGAASAFIQVAMSRGQRHVDAARAAVIYSLEPVLGGLIGFTVGEALGEPDGAGGVIIVAGVVIASVPRLVIRTSPRWRRIDPSSRPLVGPSGAST